MSVHLRVTFGPEWEKAALALTRANQELPKHFNQTISKNAKEAARRAQQAVIAMPTHGKKHRGTRALVARGTRAQRRGPRNYNITTTMPQGMAAIPRGYTASFRHPVFGGPTWVTQHHHYDWFMGPISSVSRETHAELHDNMEKIARQIAKSS